MEPPEFRPMEILPNEIITKIFLQVSDLKTLTNLCQTNRRIQGICQTDHFWKTKYKHDFPNFALTGNQPWKEKYKLVYTVPRSPISMGIGHYAIIDDQNMLHMGGDSRPYNDTYIRKMSKISPFKQKVRSVSCGDHFTGAITEDGKVYLRGERLDTTFGKRNLKILEPREYPIPGRAIKIVCGPKISRNIQPMFAVILEDRSIFLRMDYIFENNTERALSVRLNIEAKDISTNGRNLAIVSTDGKLYYLGENMNDRDENDIGIILKDGQITINPVHIPIPSAEKIKQVSLGTDHIGVLSEKGNIYLWGSNKFGQLGQGWKEETEHDVRRNLHLNSYVEHPQKLSFHTPISFISCRDKTTAAIDENGILYRWGWDGGLVRRAQYPNPSEITSQKLRNDFGNIRKYPIIPRPIQITLVLSDSCTITNKFRYVVVGERITITTTTDGWADIQKNWG